MPSNLQDRVLDYPYDFPKHCFLYLEGMVLPIHHTKGKGSIVKTPVGFVRLHKLLGSVDKRIPVLAYGSNQAPSQLARKLHHLSGADTAVPVIRGVLRDFDTVYAAHIARYGAVPATLHPSSGTIIELAVTYLSESQLNIMHRTEGRGQNYDFVRLQAVDLALANGVTLCDVYAYICRKGALTAQGEPIALAAIKSQRRRFPAQTMIKIFEELQNRILLCDTMMQVENIAALVEILVSDPEQRAACAALLTKHSCAFAYPGTERIIG